MKNNGKVTIVGDVADKEVENFNKWVKESEEMEKHFEKEKKEQAEKDLAHLNTGRFDGTVVNWNYDLDGFIPKHQQTYLSVSDKEGRQMYIGVTELLKMISFCAGRDFAEIPFWWGYNVCKKYDIPPYEFFKNVYTKEEIAVRISNEHLKLHCAGNNNMNNPLANDVFFEALEAYQHKLEEIRIHVANGYVCFYEKDKEVIYDSTPNKILSDEEWNENAHKWYCEKKNKKEGILQRAGLLNAWNALEEYLNTHFSVPTIVQDGLNGGLERTAWAKIHRSLTHGYKLGGVEVFADNQIVWELYVYDRVIEDYDVLRGMDAVYLLYDGKEIHPAVRSTTMKMYKNEHIEEDETDGYSIIE